MIFLLGEVSNPGSYGIMKPISVTEGIRLADGHLSSAKLNSVIVIRKHGDKLIARRVDLGSPISLKTGERSFFYLSPDDIVYVPERWVSRAANIIDEIERILFSRGWSLTGLIFENVQ